MVDAFYHDAAGSRWSPAMIEALPTPFQRKYRVAWYTKTSQGSFEPVWVNKQLGDYSISLQAPNELRPLSDEAARHPRFTQQTIPTGASKAWLHFSEPEETTAEDGNCFKVFYLLIKIAFS